MCLWGIIGCNTCSILQEKWFYHVKTQFDELLDEVCVNMRKEPTLQEVNNEDLPQKGKQTKVKKPVSISVHSISGGLVNKHF